jgi:hypothetical protein
MPGERLPCSLLKEGSTPALRPGPGHDYRIAEKRKRAVDEHGLIGRI